MTPPDKENFCEMIVRFECFTSIPRKQAEGCLHYGRREDDTANPTRCKFWAISWECGCKAAVDNARDDYYS